jgi:hypothetical protein
MGVQYVNIVQCILSFLDIPSITRLKIIGQCDAKQIMMLLI